MYRTVHELGHKQWAMRIADNYGCSWPFSLRVINLRELWDLNFRCAGTPILETMWFGKGVFPGRISIIDHHLKECNKPRSLFLGDGGFSRWNLSLINHYYERSESIDSRVDHSILDIVWSCQLDVWYNDPCSRSPTDIRCCLSWSHVVPSSVTAP